MKPSSRIAIVFLVYLFAGGIACSGTTAYLVVAACLGAAAIGAGFSESVSEVEKEGKVS